MSLGFESNNQKFALKASQNGTQGNLRPYNSGYGQPVDTDVSNGWTGSGNTIGLTTDSTKSGIIADISNYQDIMWCIKY